MVTVGATRRLLALPAALSRLVVLAARVEAGQLRVRFAEPTEAARPSVATGSAARARAPQGVAR